MANNQLDEIVEALLQFKTDLQSGVFVNNICKKLVSYVSQDLKDIFITSVDNYYEAYKPKYYKRTQSFYDAYDIKSNGTSIIIDFDASMMPDHNRVSGEYIYNYMFSQGYHGGATKGKPDINNNPFPGPMALRTPPYGEGAFSLWSDTKATKTEAPEKMINDNIDAYENGNTNYSVSNLMERGAYALDDALSKYALFK